MLHCLDTKSTYRLTWISTLKPPVPTRNCVMGHFLCKGFPAGAILETPRTVSGWDWGFDHLSNITDLATGQTAKPMPTGGKAPKAAKAPRELSGQVSWTIGTVVGSFPRTCLSARCLRTVASPSPTGLSITSMVASKLPMMHTGCGQGYRACWKS